MVRLWPLAIVQFAVRMDRQLRPAVLRYSGIGILGFVSIYNFWSDILNRQIETV